MSQFHNPYHFVPTDEEPPECVPLSELSPARGKAGETIHAPHLAHARFVPGTRSGRLVCKATVETPLICGNRQDEREGWTKLIHPFELRANEPALPASALRGMLSALAEAASGSSLRVLKDVPLSHRMAAASESLSAVGLLVERTDDQGRPVLKLQPLTVPTVDREDNDSFEPTYSEVFQSHFRQPLLKAYVNGYRRTGGSSVGFDHGSFLERNRPDSRSADNAGFWYAKLTGTVGLAGRKVVATAGIRDNRNRRFLLARQIAGDPIKEEVFQSLPENERAAYTRGFLRVLGIQGREKEIPTTKKHEYFIPYPEGSEHAIPVFEVAEALNNFHRLADQRTETDPELPFEVAGSARNSTPGPNHRQLRLRAGDLVYFRPDPDDPTVIAEVSVSSIWRAGNGSVHEYFAAISPDLLPLSPARMRLTLAEQLFGTVEIRDPHDQHRNADASFAFASRLRVSHGILADTPERGAYQPQEELLSRQQTEARQRLHLQDIPLQNLASPKPPSPALYFKPKGAPAEFVRKQRLNPGNHSPQGRKFYLRRNPATYDASVEAFVHPGRLIQENLASIGRQHQSVGKFVRPGTTFFFHLDFDNLTDRELQLLAYTLAPSTGFRHQLGHGKPLGLGQVRIEIAALLEINRGDRYTGDIRAARWHRAWLAGTADSLPPSLRRGLPESPDPLAPELETMRKSFESWATQCRLIPALRAIELLGQPVADGVPVHYPQAGEVNRGTANNPDWRTIEPGTAAFEMERYHWFTQNDDTKQGRQPGQFLLPLVNERGQSAAALPKLDRYQNQRPPHASYVGRALAPVPPGPTAASPDQPEAIRSDSARRGMVSPRDLVGREVIATAGEPKEGRIPFLISLDGQEFPGLNGYFSVSKYERASFAKENPPGTTRTAKVVNVQSATSCELK